MRGDNIFKMSTASSLCDQEFGGNQPKKQENLEDSTGG